MHSLARAAEIMANGRRDAAAHPASRVISHIYIYPTIGLVSRAEKKKTTALLTLRYVMLVCRCWMDLFSAAAGLCVVI